MDRANHDEARKERRKMVDDMLSKTFNSIQYVERASLSNRLTEGLSIAELHTIYAVGLYECNPMKVIAERLNVTLATVTVAIDKLVRKGFMCRIRSEEDRRKVLVKLTTKGRKAYRAHDAFHRNMVDTALAGLSPEEEEAFLLTTAERLPPFLSTGGSRMGAEKSEGDYHGAEAYCAGGRRYDGRFPGPGLCAGRISGKPVERIGVWPGSGQESDRPESGDPPQRGDGNAGAVGRAGEADHIHHLQSVHGGL